eukprot:CAMPEP_0176332142 /NCGR_PEP_ID=MMETSP0121_2-20121125/76923_1 /TAXON_ID=160619 /ORGANISM="Kryptoperidinium foliaceum, Strain CCMP 1326" /LENGTH=471 /DNA_ID=CAMNT_0017675029 /DNA_START=30 /DNA_END=1445 /DNA_ORIENTATION=-
MSSAMVLGGHAASLRPPHAGQAMAEAREQPETMARLAWERARPQQQSLLVQQLRLLQKLVPMQSQRFAQSSRALAGGMPALAPSSHAGSGYGAVAGPRSGALCHEPAPPSFRSHETPMCPTPCPWPLDDEGDGQPQFGPQRPLQPQQQWQEWQQEQEPQLVAHLRLQQTAPRASLGIGPQTRNLSKEECTVAAAPETPSDPQSQFVLDSTQPQLLPTCPAFGELAPRFPQSGDAGPPGVEHRRANNSAWQSQLPQQPPRQPAHAAPIKARSLSSTEDGATASGSSGSEQESPGATAGFRHLTWSERERPHEEALERQQQQQRQPLQDHPRSKPFRPQDLEQDSAPASGASAHVGVQGALRCPSLRDALQHVQQIGDDGRIIALRRVRQLGDDAETLLEEHFGRSARIESLLTYTVFKGNGRNVARLGDLAFMVVAARSDVARILQGPDRVCVAGFAVDVGPFQRSSSAAFQ